MSSALKNNHVKLAFFSIIFFYCRIKLCTIHVETNEDRKKYILKCVVETPSFKKLLLF